MAKVRTPKKGDIWHINPDPVAGKELRDKHYFIVITEEALNMALGVAICAPISTVANAARSVGVTVAVTPESTAKGNIRGVVLCHQVKAMDVIARGAKFETVAEHYLIEEVVLKLIDLIDPQ